MRDVLERLRRTPTIFQLGHVQKTEDGDDGHVLVWSYDALDPVDVPRGVLETVMGWDLPEPVKRKLFWDNAARLYARYGG